MSELHPSIPDTLAKLEAEVDAGWTEAARHEIRKLRSLIRMHHSGCCGKSECSNGCAPVLQNLDGRRARAEDALRKRLAAVVADAKMWGFVATIDLQPTQPLRMGGYEMVADVRNERGAA